MLTAKLKLASMLLMLVGLTSGALYYARSADVPVAPHTGDPPAVQADDRAKEQRPDTPWLGAWKQDAKQLNLIRLESGRLSQFKDGKLRFQRIAVVKGEIWSIDFAGDKKAPQKLEVKDGRLILTTDAGKGVAFLKLKEVPKELTIPSLEIGKGGDVPAKRVREIQAELARREECNIKIRTEWRALKDAKAKAAKLQEMWKIDADDSRFLTQLIKDLGWIDSRRFGDAAEHSAYLIVMHTHDLTLMQGALPELEKETRAKRFNPEMFAGLFDRFRSIVALPERYGMHVSPDAKGDLVVGPLEDPRRVDDLRRDIGLPPLALYLQRYEKERQKVRIVE
jgi:hypothetical protein